MPAGREGAGRGAVCPRYPPKADLRQNGDGLGRREAATAPRAPAQRGTAK